MAGFDETASELESIARHLRLTAVCLARIAADLVGDLAEWWHAAPGDLLARLREHHAEGGG